MSLKKFRDFALTVTFEPRPWSWRPESVGGQNGLHDADTVRRWVGRTHPWKYILGVMNSFSTLFLAQKWMPALYSGLLSIGIQTKFQKKCKFCANSTQKNQIPVAETIF